MQFELKYVEDDGTVHEATVVDGAILVSITMPHPHVRFEAHATENVGILVDMTVHTMHSLIGESPNLNRAHQVVIDVR